MMAMIMLSKKVPVFGQVIEAEDWKTTDEFIIVQKGKKQYFIRKELVDLIIGEINE